jgi:hypothetical protein
MYNQIATTKLTLNLPGVQHPPGGGGGGESVKNEK